MNDIRLVLLDETRLLVADDGGLRIELSTDARLQMNSTPDSPPTAATTYVNLFQSNYVAFKAERLINWQLAPPAAVAWVSGASYKGT